MNLLQNLFMKKAAPLVTPAPTATLGTPVIINAPVVKNNPMSTITIGTDYQLSTNFTFGMLVATEHREYIAKNFEEGKQYVENMRLLCKTVLEPVIEILGIVPHINSCFRFPELNKSVGGSTTSQHMIAEAADTTYGKMNLHEAFNKIAFSAAKKIPFSQIIFEFNSWIHLGVIDPVRYPGKVAQILTTGKDAEGKTIYIPVKKPL